MTTGTQGSDNLTNDPAVSNEVVGALAGDDFIRITRPNIPQMSEGSKSGAATARTRS